MYLVDFGLLAREYASRECRYMRGKLIEIHRDWMKTRNSDVFCFGNRSSPICGVNSPLGIFELCN